MKVPCSLRGAAEVLYFLKRFDAEMPEGPDIYLMKDNYASCKAAKITACLTPLNVKKGQT